MQELELVIALGSQLQIYGAVEERLPVPVHGGNQSDHILQVALCSYRLLEIIGGGTAHPVLVGGVVDDALLLGRGHLAGVDTQGDAILFSQMPQNGLLIRGGRIFPQRPDASVSVPAQVMVHIELNDRGGHHIKKLLDLRIRRHLREIILSALCQNCDTSCPAGKRYSWHERWPGDIS